jgi:hypothetical protein
MLIWINGLDRSPFCVEKPRQFQRGRPWPSITQGLNPNQANCLSGANGEKCGRAFLRAGLAATLDCLWSGRADSGPDEFAGGTIAKASPGFAVTALLAGQAAAASETSMLRSDAACWLEAIGVLVSKTTRSGHFRSEWMRIAG